MSIPIDLVTDFVHAVLIPNANYVDQHGIERSQLDELAATGAFGLPYPVDFGGAGASASEVREATELIAGACGTTWFCFAQHRSPTTALMRSENIELRDRWLPKLVAGEAIAGIAFAHLRRPRQSFWISETTDGWLLDGSLDWVTTWPLTDVVLIQGYLRDANGRQRDEIVSVLIEPPHVDLELQDRTEIDGLTAGPQLALAAMGGTRTWPVRFDNYLVAASQFVSRQPAADWALNNSLIAADANPASFGIARACIDELAAVARTSGQRSVRDATDALRTEFQSLRAAAYEAADAAASDRDTAIATINDRMAIRARVLDLVVRASTALIVASGGRAMTLSDDAQRHAREALFMMVQGQTSDLRAHSLGMLANSRSALGDYIGS
ncbi:MAG: acyl-CoA/acyl-ACP dehydrogenase [Actinobacteria bacterium]|nr:acyl-CoA/acyl-ACP dehydrogenase [Actinomycetota bacterium]